MRISEKGLGNHMECEISVKLISEKLIRNIIPVSIFYLDDMEILRYLYMGKQ